VITREALNAELSGLLSPENFKDYGPNGLQVEGTSEIHHVVCGVTASRALIEHAVQAQAQAILVHHGLFWRGQSPVVTGWMRARLALLLQHDINLFAYHLPLDAHPTLGNNAQLAAQLGFETTGHFGEQSLGFLGRSSEPLVNTQSLIDRVERALGRRPVCVGPEQSDLSQACLAWCTGGAQGYFEGAIEKGARAFLTGEISEPQAHLARECGVNFLACGHHATEKGGVRALGLDLAGRLPITCEFIDIDNPA
jgi:dinuclear metal center YbgI/SA1388 family protein